MPHSVLAIPGCRICFGPLVEAAGYRVIDDVEEEAADVVIASVGEDLPEEGNDRTIWLAYRA